MFHGFFKNIERYLLIGFFSFLLSFFIFLILVEIFKKYYLASAIIAYAFSSIFNFIFNKKFTFNEKIKRKFFRKYFFFVLINIFCLSINVLFLFFLTEFFHFYYAFSYITSSLFVSFLSFLLNKKLIFKNEKKVK